MEGIGFKRRNPWGVFGLSLITLFVYSFVWWYKINNELRNYGIENSPAKATLALMPGAILLGIPPLVSYYNTADRIQKAQVKSGAEERITPVLALLLYLVVSIFAVVYYQSQLNKVWDAEVKKGASVEAA
jgi:NADH:ubiquinone oxidoreductase subunit 5 (subunit L)/multisubunit Na+/H+ antiporter MnhA subunit